MKLLLAVLFMVAVCVVGQRHICDTVGVSLDTCLSYPECWYDSNCGQCRVLNCTEMFDMVDCAGRDECEVYNEGQLSAVCVEVGGIPDCSVLTDWPSLCPELSHCRYDTNISACVPINSTYADFECRQADYHQNACENMIPNCTWWADLQLCMHENYTLQSMECQHLNNSQTLCETEEKNCTYDATYQKCFPDGEQVHCNDIFIKSDCKSRWDCRWWHNELGEGCQSIFPWLHCPNYGVNLTSTTTTTSTPTTWSDPPPPPCETWGYWDSACYNATNHCVMSDEICPRCISAPCNVRYSEEDCGGGVNCTWHPDAFVCYNETQPFDCQVLPESLCTSNTTLGANCTWHSELFLCMDVSAPVTCDLAHSNETCQSIGNCKWVDPISQCFDSSLFYGDAVHCPSAHSKEVCQQLIFCEWDNVVEYCKRNSSTVEAPCEVRHSKAACGNTTSASGCVWLEPENVCRGPICVIPPAPHCESHFFDLQSCYEAGCAVHSDCHYCRPLTCTDAFYEGKCLAVHEDCQWFEAGEEWFCYNASEPFDCRNLHSNESCLSAPGGMCDWHPDQYVCTLAGLPTPCDAYFENQTACEAQPDCAFHTYIPRCYNATEHPVEPCLPDIGEYECEALMDHCYHFWPSGRCMPKTEWISCEERPNSFWCYEDPRCIWLDHANACADNTCLDREYPATNCSSYLADTSNCYANNCTISLDCFQCTEVPCDERTTEGDCLAADNCGWLTLPRLNWYGNISMCYDKNGTFDCQRLGGEEQCSMAPGGNCVFWEEIFSCLPYDPKQLKPCFMLTYPEDCHTRFMSGNYSYCNWDYNATMCHDKNDTSQHTCRQLMPEYCEDYPHCKLDTFINHCWDTTKFNNTPCELFQNEFTCGYSTGSHCIWDNKFERCVPLTCYAESSPSVHNNPPDDDDNDNDEPNDEVANTVPNGAIYGVIAAVVLIAVVAFVVVRSRRPTRLAPEQVEMHFVQERL